MPITPEQHQAIIQALTPCHPSVIYLFGSFGTNSQHPNSDIDIAFIPSFPIDSLRIFEISNLLSDKLNHQVDLIDLTKATTVMAKEVLRTGTPIHTQDLSRRHLFEMSTLSDYARLNEERHEILAK